VYATVPLPASDADLFADAVVRLTACATNTSAPPMRSGTAGGGRSV
jgi:hypothetical protein